MDSLSHDHRVRQLVFASVRKHQENSAEAFSTTLDPYFDRDRWKQFVANAIKAQWDRSVSTYVHSELRTMMQNFIETLKVQQVLPPSAPRVETEAPLDLNETVRTALVKQHLQRLVRWIEDIDSVNATAVFPSLSMLDRSPSQPYPQISSKDVFQYDEGEGGWKQESDNQVVVFSLVPTKPHGIGHISTLPGSQRVSSTTNTAMPLPPLVATIAGLPAFHLTAPWYLLAACQPEDDQRTVDWFAFNVRPDQVQQLIGSIVTVIKRDAALREGLKEFSLSGCIQASMSRKRRT